MPALQTVAIADRETTPVTHTFQPRDVNGGVGLVVANAGIPVNEERMTVSMRRSGSKFKGKVTLALPIVATAVINGVSTPTLVRTAFATAEFTFDETSTAQERKNIVGLLANSLLPTVPLVNGALINLEGVFG